MNEADFIHIAGPSKHRSALNKADELASELSIVYVKVQMFDDVPSFIGSDLMLYSLKKDAIARVPGDISDVLCKRRKQIRKTGRGCLKCSLTLRICSVYDKTLEKEELIGPT